MFQAQMSQKIIASAQVHTAILDEFIRVTKEKMIAHDDAFVRDSLTDLLSGLRDERDGYARLVEARELAPAA